MKHLRLILLLLILGGCATKASSSEDLVSAQILDRNGFSETVNGSERLKTIGKTDFLTPQPYQKVVRVYGKSSQGKTLTKMTTYHTNGQPWQYLEIKNGRAYGKFLEWHSNGQLKIDAMVIEGTPDVSEMAQMTWLFEETSLVYNDKGHLIAKIPYNKGLLQGPSHHFYPDGKISKVIPYHQDEIDGLVQVFDEAGACIEQISYTHGEKDGAAFAYWTESQLKYREEYQKGFLLNAEYFNSQGEKIAQIEKGEGIQALFKDRHLTNLIDYHAGVIEGKVRFFNSTGQLISLLHMKDGMKNGEEWEYYPTSSPSPQPKLYVQWRDNVIQGVAKTWYENGTLESQREMHDNKKHGLSFAWFKEGDLMFMEEYEMDHLTKGSYFKKWEKNPVSKVENGKGVVTLFDKEGKFLKKIMYERGQPQNEL